MDARQNPGDWASDFGALVDLVVPCGGLALVLSAYFDASEQDDGIFSVAGFALDRPKRAARRWNALWGNTLCHMSDLHTRKKGSNFESWSPDQAGERLKESVRLINRHVRFGVAVSCDLKEIAKLAPKTAPKGSERLLDGFKSAYATCCHLAMFCLGDHIRLVGHQESKIAYFFEAGDKNQAEAARFWDLAAAVPPLKNRYLHFSHTVIAKADCRLLEMSDIFAWEWAKHRERTRKLLPMRRSLLELLDSNRDGFSSPRDFASDNRRAVHLTGEPLERYFAQVKTLILA